MNDQQTAATRYDVHLDLIMNLLDEIRADIAMHNVAFNRNGRRSWNYVGDLAHVEDILCEAHNFLTNNED